MLKTKWKYKEMNSFLTKSLAKQNKHAIRKLALETLLIYIECMLDGTAMAEVNELLNLFAGVVNLPVFIDEIASTTGTTIRLKYLPPSGTFLVVIICNRISKYTQFNLCHS